MPVTAQQAASYINDQNRRHRKPVPEWMKDGGKPVYIYNIFNQRHTVPLGGLGTFYIPACEEGKPYSDPLKITGIVVDEYDLGDGGGNMAWNPFQGKEIAEDVVGIHSASPQCDVYTTNREWWGVFIAAGEVPTKQELADARKKLEKFATTFVQHADRLALEGEKGLKEISAQHRTFAHLLKQRRSWAEVPVAMNDCPGCGDPIKPGVVRHTCGAILDPQKALTLGMITAEQAAVMSKK